MMQSRRPINAMTQSSHTDVSAWTMLQMVVPLTMRREAAQE